MPTRKTAAKTPSPPPSSRTAARATSPKPTGLRGAATLSAAEIYINRMPGPGRPRPPVMLKASLQVDNHTDQELSFEFQSAQRFDIALCDRRGRVVTTWSQNKRFAAGLQQERLGPGKSWTFSGEIGIGDTAERKLTPGPYEVRIYLTANRILRLSLPITIAVAF